MASWNVLATSLEGRRDALLMALRRLGKFRRGGYRNVVVGAVEPRVRGVGTGPPSPLRCAGRAGHA